MKNVKAMELQTLQFYISKQYKNVLNMAKVYYTWEIYISLILSKKFSQSFPIQHE